MVTNEGQEDPMAIGPPGWRVEVRPRNNEIYLGKIDLVDSLRFCLERSLGFIHAFEMLEKSKLKIVIFFNL